MTISFVMDFDQHSFLTGHGVSAKTKLFSSQIQQRGQHISTCVFQMSHVQNIRNCSGTQVCCVSVQILWKLLYITTDGVHDNMSLPLQHHNPYYVPLLHTTCKIIKYRLINRCIPHGQGSGTTTYLFS